MHLYWNMDPNLGPLVEASAVLEILEAPTVAKTYFWALQASFTDNNGTDHGAAHLGLQWYPPHPNSGAVNWGGYPPQHSNWQVTLTGSESPLPSSTDDPNTRDYPWQVGVRYRLRIFPSPDKGWRATITDLSTGTVDLVRDLWLGGNQVKSFIVWTEWFCGRRDPSVSVRWSEFVAIDSYGVAHAPDSLLVNHPAEGFGNTSHIVEESGPHAKVLQVMNHRRKVRHGTVIPVGGSPLGLPPTRSRTANVKKAQEPTNLRPPQRKTLEFVRRSSEACSQLLRFAHFRDPTKSP